MADIKFGRKQLSNPTPSKIEFRLKVYVAVMSLVVSYLQTAAYLPALAKEISTGVLSLSVAIAVAITPFFGVHVTGEVDAEDVTAMDDEAK